MQLGVPPIMISDYDMRPFPDKINWHSCSFFINSVKGLPKLLDYLDEHELEIMGGNAQYVWKLLFDNWPEYVLDILR
jgi:hypothetical protein